jgi:hypothetical protein
VPAGISEAFGDIDMWLNAHERLGTAWIRLLHGLCTPTSTLTGTGASIMTVHNSAIDDAPMVQCILVHGHFSDCACKHYGPMKHISDMVPCFDYTCVHAALVNRWWWPGEGNIWLTPLAAYSLLTGATWWKRAWRPAGIQHGCWPFDVHKVTDEIVVYDVEALQHRALGRCLKFMDLGYRVGHRVSATPPFLNMDAAHCDLIRRTFHANGTMPSFGVVSSYALDFVTVPAVGQWYHVLEMNVRRIAVRTLDKLRKTKQPVDADDKRYHGIVLTVIMDAAETQAVWDALTLV